MCMDWIWSRQVLGKIMEVLADGVFGDLAKLTRMNGTTTSSFLFTGCEFIAAVKRQAFLFIRSHDLRCILCSTVLTINCHNHSSFLLFPFTFMSLPLQPGFLGSNYLSPSIWRILKLQWYRNGSMCSLQERRWGQLLCCAMFTDGKMHMYWKRAHFFHYNYLLLHLIIFRSSFFDFLLWGLL